MSSLAIKDRCGAFFCGVNQKAVDDHKIRLQDGKYVDGKGKRVLDASAQVRTTLVALAVISLLAAVMGALVYFNIMSIGLNAVGALSQQSAFWLMIAGGSTAVASTILAIVQKSCQNISSKKEEVHHE